MEIEKLLIKKEEIPIRYYEEIPTAAISVPIHPKLLDEDVRFDANIAHEIFPSIISEWYNDLTQYTKTLPNGKTKDWFRNVFLSELPTYETEYEGTSYERYKFRTWEDKVFTDERGFVTTFEINRNVGGSLFLSDHYNNQYSYIGRPGILFSEEKRQLYEGAKVYEQHNVDHYPGALFLRNWSIKYLNEILKTL